MVAASPAITSCGKNQMLSTNRAERYKTSGIGTSKTGKGYNNAENKSKRHSRKNESIKHLTDCSREPPNLSQRRQRGVPRKVVTGETSLP